MVLETNFNILIKRLNIAISQYYKTKSKSERLALDIYIKSLRKEIKNLVPKLKNLNDNFCYTPNLQKELFEDEETYLDQYYMYNEFHKHFFEPIYKKLSHQYGTICDLERPKLTNIDDIDIYKLFEKFAQTIGLGDLFVKYQDEKRIHFYENSTSSDRKGFIIHNPINNTNDIFIRKDDYAIDVLITIAHEFGHAYEFITSKKNVKEYNNYYYGSFFLETISMTFQELFIDYLIEKNMLYSDAIYYKYLEHYYYDDIANAYIYSLIDQDNLLFGDLSPTEIYKIVNKYFSKNDKIKYHINNFLDKDIKNTYRYAYGKVFSMFLKEKIKNDGYKLDISEDFIKHNGESFDLKLLNRYNITPQNYIELHKNETTKLKKICEYDLIEYKEKTYTKK